MKKITQKILLVFLVALLGSFFCVKSIEGVHSQFADNQVSIEQTCCDTLHGPSITKILPNGLVPQAIFIAWIAVYFVGALILFSGSLKGQFFDSPRLVPSFIRLFRGVVQRE